jgi:hypothetical protein
MSRLELRENVPEAAGYPVAYIIVEWAGNQSMKLITEDIFSAEGAMRAGYSVAEDSVQSFLGGQQVVQ